MSEFANAFEQRIVQRYAESYHLFKKKFLDFVGERAGPELLIYGCGARSSFFANIFFPEVDIKFVDDRFEKVGKIVPGCMAPIFSWNKDFSSKYILLGVNSEAEYAVIRKRGLGSGAFCSILPPSLNLPDFWRNFQGAS